MMSENEVTTNRRNSRIILYVVIVLIVIFGLMQVVRFIVPHFKLDNPPVTYTVNWDSPETEQLWNTACADCHSNETVYPWYSYVAPVGWFVAHHTHEGRENLNISTGHHIEVDEMLEEIKEGKMPLSSYTLIHTDARLSESETEALVSGLQATFGGENGSQDNEDNEHQNEQEEDGD